MPSYLMEMQFDLDVGEGHMHLWGFILACTVEGPCIKGRTIKLWSENVKGGPAMPFIPFSLVQESSGQGRVEGCHRTSAATHLIYGLESV